MASIGIGQRHALATGRWGATSAARPPQGITVTIPSGNCSSRMTLRLVSRDMLAHVHGSLVVALREEQVARPDR